MTIDPELHAEIRELAARASAQATTKTNTSFQPEPGDYEKAIQTLATATQKLADHLAQ